MDGDIYNEDTNDEDIDDEETNEEFYEATYTYVMAIYALIDILNQFLNMMRGEHIERPLTRRQITSRGYDYIHKALNDDPAIFRQIVGQNTRYCVIRNTFGRSQFATSENFHKILKALNSLAPDLMVRPSSTVPEKIRESTRFYPYFKDCIGAIDGTHIPASVKGRDVSSYRDRHGNISQNVLAACNFDLEFMYVLSGWEGSAHDSKVLSDVLARKNGLKVPQGKYYLVDCGFPNRRKFLAPYRGVRYHLQDFAGHGNDHENEKELFNLRHASLRNVIERIFGIFKSRFTIFKSAPPFLFKTQAELVLACAALHNFLRKECRSDEFPVEPTDESSSSSSVLPNYEDNDHEPIVQTQEQEREDTNIWRTNIGSDMWRNANN
ncbi:protein ALP1-like [Glycine soja]|uniref:protein ALP1-like n=1 Tax=Glycine soja TaxID=3848 RepID=UPI00103E14E4|nr:protein ALP1-like [Glycine soja]